MATFNVFSVLRIIVIMGLEYYYNSPRISHSLCKQSGTFYLIIYLLDFIFYVQKIITVRHKYYYEKILLYIIWYKVIWYWRLRRKLLKVFTEQLIIIRDLSNIWWNSRSGIYIYAYVFICLLWIFYLFTFNILIVLAYFARCLVIQLK